MSGRIVKIDVDLDDLDQDELLEHVGENYRVAEVFSNNDIASYAKDNLGVFDVYDEDDIRKVLSTERPEDYFPESDLADWANRNGWKGPN